jgi:hypothetical protein
LGSATETVEASLTGIDWAALLLPQEGSKGAISHGYPHRCGEPPRNVWRDFGTESASPFSFPPEPVLAYVIGVCGRFMSGITGPFYKRFKIRVRPDGLVPRDNITPGRMVSVVISEGQNTVVLMHWGLIPRRVRGRAPGSRGSMRGWRRSRKNRRIAGCLLTTVVWSRPANFMNGKSMRMVAIRAP